MPSLVFSSLVYYGDGKLWAVRGDTGATIFSIYDGNHRLDQHAYVSTGDIDKDGLPEIVILEYCPSSSRCSILVYEHDGTLKWDNSQQVNDWINSHSIYAPDQPFVRTRRRLSRTSMRTACRRSFRIDRNQPDGSIRWATAISDPAVDLGQARLTGVPMRPRLPTSISMEDQRSLPAMPSGMPMERFGGGITRLTADPPRSAISTTTHILKSL